MTITVEARKDLFRSSSEKRIAPLAKAQAERRVGRPRDAVLGGSAAWQLVTHDKAEAVVLEQRDEVGGNAGGFEPDALVED